MCRTRCRTRSKIRRSPANISKNAAAAPVVCLLEGQCGHVFCPRGLGRPLLRGTGTGGLQTELDSPNVRAREVEAVNSPRTAPAAPPAADKPVEAVFED